MDTAAFLAAEKPLLENALSQATAAALKGPLVGGNPQVGCVLLKDGKVIAQGFHRGSGTPHAEADALAKAGAAAAGATAVVTLEPCNHVGRTPACSESLIAAGVSRVVYACADPNAVASGGAATLNRAGVVAVTAKELGLDAQVVAAAQQVTAQWRTVMERSRPWVIAKTAASLDGKISDTNGVSKWVTGEDARADAHQHLRSQVDAIVVGTQTVIADDPALTVRAGTPSAFSPLPVVVGKRDLPPSSQLLQRPHLHLRTHDWEQVLSELFQRKVRRVLLEGGPTLIGSALAAGVVDEWWYYVAPFIMGQGGNAVKDFGCSHLQQAQRFEVARVRQVGADVCIEMRIR